MRRPRLLPLACALLAATLAPRAAAQECVVSPSPHPVQVRQPDGTTLELRLRGSGRNTWYEDAQGHPVVETTSGFYYGRLDANGRLVPAGVLAGIGAPEAAGIPRRVNPTPPPAATAAPGPIAPVGPTGGKSAAGALGLPTGVVTHPPSIGTVKNLVLLLRFSNHGPSGQNRTLPSAADVGTIMNAVGGHPSLAPTGSVRDHYLETSYGQLTIDSDVVGWLDVPESESAYANNNSGLTSKTWDLIIDGLDLADPSVDFSQYDIDGDGWVDAITFLHSGYGAEWGGTDAYGTHYSDRMWSHKWSIPTWTSAEGVKVSPYNISPGLWGVSGSSPGRIGVVCHELGHFFGLPDMYDTDGSSEGLGNWGLMGGGSWGFDGSQQYPSHLSAWSKVKMGWLVPTRLLPGSHSLTQVESSPSIFRIDSGYPPGEYLLLENRQPTGFDGALPQGGLAVWHVDETKGSFGSNNPNTDEGYAGQSGWPGNGRHYRAALLQADGGYDMEHGFDRGDGGDVYHAGGVSTIDGSTTPGTDAYQGGNIVANGNRILSIGSAGASMGFQYQSPQAPTITTSSLPNGSIGVAYSQGLSATGGNSPLWWSEFVESPSYWEQDLGSSLYSSVGSAQGWNADEGLWQLSLPFDFPFYETVYDTVWVSSNGFLDFAPGDTEPFNDSLYVRSLHRIAPLWDDLRTDAGAGQDIYVATGTPGQVTIRWVGEHYDTGSNVRFAVTLFEDGRVRFDYGSGNSSISPTVGISRGEGAQQILVAGYDGMGGLGNADSILFTLQGSQLPPGLSLSSAGVLSGTPTANGSWSPWFRVTDDDRRYDMVQLSVSVGADCNNNGVDDATDIANGTSQDCNANGVPDECELTGNDCNANGVPDECDVDCNSNGTPDDCESITDCNANSIPDECELAGNDCNANGVPDECDVDCNTNGTPDDCESITDCNANSIPDECELAGNDCNANGIPDECDVDCNTNGTPDDCESITDCNANSIPDECELAGNDCNANGVPDECDVDCNTNGTPDDCESITDCNANSIPDECELAGNDCNANGVPDECDVDCNTNGTPDDCESITDCNANSIPDECELAGNDCNANGIPDECDVDCNTNGTPDDCESITDCNGNSIPDECELAGNDCNANGVPDECDVDCNSNGTPDDCESITDCNANSIPDECELAGNDCNANGVPDECDVDCNSNGTPDDCESITDCNANSIPDECELAGNDCNANGIPDECDVDCNANGTPDDCESITDCNSNSIPDECELAGNDCNANGIPDECDVDCNSNGTPDDCESITDCNANSIPDECELAGNDCNTNGIPDECDVDCNANGTPDDCESITDCNGNSIPDECELAGNDCNANLVPDECDVDCNSNGTPDDCESITDCNANSIPDECELAGNDCNANLVPDECDVDCNSNGTPDDCESITDCNANSIPDECELAGNDCNANLVPDECDFDCNSNGTPDDCESITDCNGNSIPDECELAGNDCNANLVPDECDVDCNSNGTPDDCESITDCNGNSIPDECELAGNDCNANLVPDECDVDCNSNGTPDDCESITDCNSNGVPDECDIAGGGSLDADVDGVPDECQTVGAYMCFGDGSSGACPCGNSAAPGEGCRNSTGVGGRLAASGSALVSNDDLVLHASQCRPNRNGVFLQGTTAIAAPFKDGILCMGNPTERLEFITLDAAGNGSSTASIVTEGLVTPGVTRYYQFWFRDGGGQSVCGQNSNLTSGLRVDWL